MRQIFNILYQLIWLAANDLVLHIKGCMGRLSMHYAICLHLIYFVDYTHCMLIAFTFDIVAEDVEVLFELPMASIAATR